MKIFFDLDGTILDSSERLYKLFCELVPECKLSKKEYWELKRNKINHQMILEKYYPKRNFEVFNEKWLEKIESKDYLKYNKLYDFSKNILEKLSKNHQLYLLTARKSKINLIKEVERLKIKDYFADILVTENIKTKIEILKNFTLDKDDVLIGDTGKDIETAQKAGIKSVAVCWGFLSKESLEDYSPDNLIDDAARLLQIIEEIK